MGFFSKKENKNNSNLSIKERMDNLKKEVNEIAHKIKDEKNEEFQLLFLVSEKKDSDNEIQVGLCGNPHQVIKAINAAGIKERAFGAIIVSAASYIESEKGEFKKLGEDLRNSDSNCDCPSCRERRGEGIENLAGGLGSLEDIGKMSKSEIDEMLNKIGKRKR